MTFAETHTHTAQSLIQQAEEYFQKGDTPQASKSAWDAVEYYVDALAEERGWDHKTYLDLSRAVSRVAEECDDPRQMRILYLRMTGLHANAYENWYEDIFVKESLDDAKELIDMLEKVVARTSDSLPGETSSNQPKVHAARG